MHRLPTCAEPLLAHAKFYENIAKTCADASFAFELRYYARQCIELASLAAKVDPDTMRHPERAASTSIDSMH